MKREERNEMIDHRGNEIEQCLQTIEFLSESTEDYLFLWDFQTGNLHFSNPVYEKYNLPKREEYVYQIQDLERCVSVSYTHLYCINHGSGRSDKTHPYT